MSDDTIGSPTRVQTQPITRKQLTAPRISLFAETLPPPKQTLSASCSLGKISTATMHHIGSHPFVHEELFQKAQEEYRWDPSLSRKVIQATLRSMAKPYGALRSHVQYHIMLFLPLSL